MPSAKVLVVDDDSDLLITLEALLMDHGFNVTVASNVLDALKKINNDHFDVLLSELHMPGAGDGLTVIGAMRHANPQAVTMLLSAFPHLDAAAKAIQMQTDEVLVKPVDERTLITTIKLRLAAGQREIRVVESVASILERSSDETIAHWFSQVQLETKLMAIPMTFEQRSGHLPQVILDLVARLRSTNPLGSKELLSAAAYDHGVVRRRQGYTAAMMVEESRILQVSIFRTLQNNLANVDFSVVPIDVMTIADEVDSQLSQAMESYLAESIVDAMPAHAQL